MLAMTALQNLLILDKKRNTNTRRLTHFCILYILCLKDQKIILQKKYLFDYRQTIVKHSQAIPYHTKSWITSSCLLFWGL